MRSSTSTRANTRKGQTTFWKILNHDFSPPLQGGQPIFDGKTFPFKLNGVKLDVSDTECGQGWNFVSDIETGFKIAGMWRTGRPNAILKVEPSDDKIQRGNKWRCSVLNLQRFAELSEIQSAIERFSTVFGAHTKEMAREQILWFEALSRPLHDENAVTLALETALSKRGLKWKLRKYEAARSARDSWEEWAARDARDSWAARDARSARASWDAWTAWTARAAWAARDSWAARDARAARDAWLHGSAWAARDAWAALSVQFESRQKWITQPADLLTTGIRDAYFNGLELAIPVDKDTLGFAMCDKPRC
jgi:hypothetical protein